MKIFVIASGSSGNSCYIESQEHKILIDVGISYRRIGDALLEKGHNINDVDLVFLTHEHIDHVAGLAVFLKKSNATLYITRGCFEALARGSNYAMREALRMHCDKSLVKIIERKSRTSTYGEILLGSTIVQPVPTFHDAAEPVGYVVKDGLQKVTLITDTGYIHNANFTYINNSDCYVLECNHDPEILMNSNRPYSLKMRILSDHGHLSNEDALYGLSMAMGERTKIVFYAHISEECNLTEIIDLTRKRVFNDVGISTEGVNFVFTSRTPTEEYIL